MPGQEDTLHLEAFQFGLSARVHKHTGGRQSCQGLPWVPTPHPETQPILNQSSSPDPQVRSQQEYLQDTEEKGRPAHCQAPCVTLAASPPRPQFCICKMGSFQRWKVLQELGRMQKAQSEGHEGGLEGNVQGASHPPVRVEKGVGLTWQEERPSESGWALTRRSLCLSHTEGD